MIAIVDRTPPDGESLQIVKQVLTINAMLVLCEQIGRYYVLLPAEILMAYQDTEYRKFDPLLWRDYLCALLDVLNDFLHHLPKPVADAYQRVMDARNYGNVAVAS